MTPLRAYSDHSGTDQPEERMTQHRHAWSIAAAIVIASVAVAVTQSPAPTTGRLIDLLRSNAFREAHALASTCANDTTADAETLAICGLALLKAGRIPDAETAFARVLGRAPGNPEAHLGQGQICRIRNDAAGALAHLRQAVPSTAFYAEALRQLWRAVWEQGDVAELAAVRTLAETRFGAAGQPLPSWLTNATMQVQGTQGRLFDMQGPADRVTVPLIARDGTPAAIRMATFTLNGKGPYAFDVDSALAEFMSVSPLLAEELGLAVTGHSVATGVGTATTPVRFAMLDRVQIGPITFRHVPVAVPDIPSFRGQRKGLIGTGFLKRFNVTIDVHAGTMDLFPLDQPEQLTNRIARSSVAADVPLYLFEQTVVEATVGAAPPALYILDSAAATHLIDRPFFEEHLKPRVDPSRIVRSGIRGAQGAQYVNRIDGLRIALGPLVAPNETMHEFPMHALNGIPGRYAAGLLGNPLLWPYRVHMNFREGRLVLERVAPSPGPAFDDARAKEGLGRRTSGSVPRT